MDFYERLIEINSQLAEGLSKLHSFNTEESKKIFLKVSRKIFLLANENKDNKKIYEKLLELFIFSASSAGSDRRELEKSFFNDLPYRLLYRILSQDNFGTKNKQERKGYKTFHEEFDAIFESAPFVANEITINRFRNLFSKHNMPNPLPAIKSLVKI